MEWRNPARWEKWETRTIQGKAYSFAHLTQFDMRLEREAKGEMAAFNIGIRVVFDCHVVTEKDDSKGPADVEGDPAYWVDTGDYCRLFHAERYELSQSLPDLIRGLPDGKTKCYVAKNANYMVWRPMGAGLQGPHYQVFFDLYRTDDPTPRLVMYVQSAYVKDNPLAVQRENQKPFATVCAELAGLIRKVLKGPRSKAKKRR
ncbi:hypothetical protein [Cupriavidus sp. D384]|uniref:hypothetical protein n=1 Tax=Cupriavidus sp. D384 TaxID=1538095 RepID=UPI0008323950|nr:hypothetical protein [Cupriavidus sp. D384]